MLRVSKRTRVPVLTGENLYGPRGFRDLILQGAADILVPDVPHVGEILEARKIAALAGSYLHAAIAPQHPRTDRLRCLGPPGWERRTRGPTVA